MDFLDIPIDGLEELNELDKYLVQPIEKVCDLLVGGGITKPLSPVSLSWLSTISVFLVSLDSLIANFY
jgi:hypothetical protein